jgi:hypothetical protein
MEAGGPRSTPQSPAVGHPGAHHVYRKRTAAHKGNVGDGTHARMPQMQIMSLHKEDPHTVTSATHVRSQRRAMRGKPLNERAVFLHI